MLNYLLFSLFLVTSTQNFAADKPLITSGQADQSIHLNLTAEHLKKADESRQLGDFAAAQKHEEEAKKHKELADRYRRHTH